MNAFQSAQRMQEEGDGCLLSRSRVFSRLDQRTFRSVRFSVASQASGACGGRLEIIRPPLLLETGLGMGYPAPGESRSNSSASLH